MAAFETGIYRNVFKECGFSEEEIAKKVEDSFNTIFYGSDEERFYHEAGEDMGYLEDTGNHDVRTEGMSYGMMVCVQLNKKKEFDRLWKWVKTYMYMDEGWGKGFFAWSCGTDGSRNSNGPAPDGEEFFVMSLMFASARWGDGEGIFNYGAEARAILSEMIHKGEEGRPGQPMFDPENKYIKFITNVKFSDPSYHLPHFYELYALDANEEDKEFCRQAAKASREYWHLVCHPKTGFSAEYAEYDGTPHVGDQQMFGGRHDWYYSDAYRTIANIGLDYSWFGKDEWQVEIANTLQRFYCEDMKDNWDGVFEIDGTVVEGVKALHPIAIIAVNAQASLAANGPYAKYCVEKFFNTPLRLGDRRYYDNFLYMFSLMALSGNYRIWNKK